MTATTEIMIMPDITFKMSGLNIKKIPKAAPVMMKFSVAIMPESIAAECAQAMLGA